MNRTAAANRIRQNRGAVNQWEKLPGINVYCRGETVTRLDETPRVMRREMSIEIELVAKGRDGEDISDQLDDMAEDVEILITKDDSLDCTVDDIWLEEVLDTEADSSGSTSIASKKLIFTALYETNMPRDDRGQGTQVDFDTLGVQWDLEPGQDEADRAIDEIDLTP